MQVEGEGACIFFVLLIILGNIIMLNLFLAILLDSFLENSEEIDEDER